MMNQGTLDLWLTGTSRAPAMRPWTPWALGLLAGALLGSAITSLAVDRMHETRAAGEIAANTREWRGPALSREWRGWRTPVDANSLFRKQR